MELTMRSRLISPTTGVGDGGGGGGTGDGLGEPLKLIAILPVKSLGFSFVISQS